MTEQHKFKIRTSHDDKLGRQLAWDRLEKYGIVEGASAKTVRITERFSDFAKSSLRHTVEQAVAVNDFATAHKYEYIDRTGAYLIAHFVGVDQFFAKHDTGDLANMAYMLSGVLELTGNKK